MTEISSDTPSNCFLFLEFAIIPKNTATGMCSSSTKDLYLSWGGVQARTNREKIFYVQTHYCMWFDEVNCLSFSKDRRPEPSGKRYILYLYTRLSAHPARLYHDSLSGWHCVLIATVNSFNVGLLVVVQPFSTLNVCVFWVFFSLKWRGTLTFLLFVLQLLFVTLGSEYKGFILDAIIIWGLLGLFWTIAVVICGIWVILCIDWLLPTIFKPM